MRKWLIFGFLFCAPAAWGQSARYQSQLIGSTGRPLANQNIAVCTQPANTSTSPCSPLATLATSLITTSGGANPLTTDLNGNFFFYAAPGTYTVQAYGPALATPFVQPDTAVGTVVTAATLPTTGTWPFAGTISGPFTESGAVKNTGSLTIGTIDNTCYVDGVVWTSIQNAITSGTCGEINDRGAFNAALGALTINRQVKILLGPTTYTFTSMAISTAFLIDGLSNATFLQYTPTTGTAITFTGLQPNVPGSGFKNVRIFGPGAGTSTTGMLYNMTAGNNSLHEHENVVIDSFGTCLTSSAGVNGIGFLTFKHSSIFGCGQNISFPTGTSGERFELIDSNVNNTFAGTNWANCFSVASSAINVRVLGGALDYCQLAVTAGFVEMGDGTYLEDTTSVIGTCTSTTSTGCAISASSTGIVTLNGMLAFISGATNQAFLGVTGNAILNVYGGTYNSNGSGSAGPIVCGASAGALTIQPFPNLINGYVGSQLWAGGCTTLNLSQASNFGLPVGNITGGNTADVCDALSNSHAGGKGWLRCDAATGSFAGSAGDLYDYDGTTNWLEWGTGVKGAKIGSGGLTATSCANTVDATDCNNFSESSAATNGTLTNLLANQAQVAISTASASTATPLEVVQTGITATTGPPIAQFESMWNNASLVGQGIVENVTNTSSAAGSLLMNLRVGNVTGFSVDKGGVTSIGGVGLTSGTVNLLGTTSGTASITGPAVAGTLTNAVVSSNAFQAGVAGTAGGILGMGGSTSGVATFTAPGVAGTVLNPVVSSNAIKTPGITVTNLLFNNTAPTIAGAGCGGSGATISANNGTAAFSIGTGTTPGSACTVTMPTATTGWVCDGNTVSAITTTNFMVKQTGAVSTTSVVLTLFTDAAATQAYAGSDTIRVHCSAY